MPLDIAGFEQLSSSSASELWPAKIWPERANYAFSEKFWIRPKLGFCPIILATGVLASQSRAL